MGKAIAIVCSLIFVGGTFGAEPPATTTAQALPDLPHIDLTGDAIPPAQLFDEISKDSGVTFLPDNPTLWGDKQIPGSVNVRINQPFWPAVQQACKLCNLGASVNEDQTIRLMRGGDGLWREHLPTSSNSVATFVAESIDKISVIKMYRPEKVRRIDVLSIETYIDPRLRAASSGLPLKIIRAEDNRGHDLQMIERELFGQTTRGWKHPMAAEFFAPTEADRIATFKAELSLIVDDKTDRWEVPDVSKFAPVTHKIDGFDVRITKISRQRNGFEVALESARGTADVKNFREFRKHLEDWVGRLELVDAAGNALYSPGAGATLGDTKVTMTREFEPRDKQAATPPVKLVWPVPVTSHVISVPLEFSDLPLP